LYTANTQVVQANTELKEANENATRANQELQAANVRERQRFDLAMDAIKHFHGEISKDLLLKLRQFEKLRGKLLRGAADFYGRLENLLERRSDKESRAALARAYAELGELTRDIGKYSDALAVVEKAIQVRRELASEPGAGDAIKLELARNLTTRGWLLEAMAGRGNPASYEEALAIVKNLRPADGMTEPLYRVESRITARIGWTYHMLYREEEAVTWLRKASEILERAIASGPPGTSSRPDKESALELVSALHSLSGPLAALGRHSEALAVQQRVLEVLGMTRDEDLGDPAIRHSRGATYTNIGAVYQGMNRPTAAISAFRAGLDVLDKLVSEYPAVEEYRRCQAGCYDGGGETLQDLGRPAEALHYYQESLAAWKKLVDDNPDQRAGPLEVAIAHNRIGWLYFGMGRMTEALEQYQAAMAIFRGGQHPRTFTERSNILINIAEIRRRQGRLAEARAACDEAILLRERAIEGAPTVPAYRVRMGECLLRSGQVRLAAGDIPRAAADWRRAIAVYEGLPPFGGEIALLQAGCHAMLSHVAGMSGSGVSGTEAAAEAAQAMAILRRIVSEGYHAPEIRNESCLDPLRGRPDFQLLMMDLAFPAEPFSEDTDAHR
jgi:tetratricopeptide (TPR) repeat protein